MKAYFFLRVKLFNRKVSSGGLPPLLVYLLISVGFVVFSIVLFDQVLYAEWIYCLLCLAFLYQFSGRNRNIFIKSVYSSNQYSRIRLLENLLITLPFVVFLCVGEYFVLAITTIAVSAIFSRVVVKNSNTWVIPAPFSQQPFEFLTGFRSNLFLVFLSYAVLFPAVIYSNFNLGIFSLLLLGYCSLRFYTKPEEDYFVWVFNTSPQEFLNNKILSGIRHFSMLIFPLLVTLCIYFQDKILIIGVVSLLCYSYLLGVIFAKYVSYPSEIGIAQSVLMVISFLLPPVLIAVIFYFHKQAKENLNYWLSNDQN